MKIAFLKGAGLLQCKALDKGLEDLVRFVLLWYRNSTPALSVVLHFKTESYLEHVGSSRRREVQRFKQVLFWIIFVTITLHHDCLCRTLFADQQHSLWTDKQSRLLVSDKRGERKLKLTWKL